AILCATTTPQPLKFIYKLNLKIKFNEMTGLLILSGGKSSRLKDKLFLKIYDKKDKKEKEILRFVYDSFKNFEFKERCIAIKSFQRERIEKIFENEIKNKNLKILIDDYDEFAPIYGILNMEKMQEEEIFLVAGDSLFAGKIYEKIMKFKEKIKDYDAIVPKHEFIEPLNSLYRKDKILNSCKISIKNKKFSIKDALSLLNVYYVEFHKDEFLNINTKDDFEKIKEKFKT
ncbi:MAG: NTP transferase domain-containing protein, partial [Candidatus Altarchaeaceae archaeon]